MAMIEIEDIQMMTLDNHRVNVSITIPVKQLGSFLSALQLLFSVWFDKLSLDIQDPIVFNQQSNSDSNDDTEYPPVDSA